MRGRPGALRAHRSRLAGASEPPRGGDRLSLEDHGGHIPDGVWARVCQRVLALAAGIWHNWLLYQASESDSPGRHFTIYDD